MVDVLESLEDGGGDRVWVATGVRQRVEQQAVLAVLDYDYSQRIDPDSLDALAVEELVGRNEDSLGHRVDNVRLGRGHAGASVGGLGGRDRANAIWTRPAARPSETPTCKAS